MEDIPDNYDCFVMHEAEQQAKLDKLPKCIDCGEPIQSETCHEFGSGHICNRCLKDREVHTEDLI